MASGKLTARVLAAADEAAHLALWESGERWLTQHPGYAEHSAPEGMARRVGVYEGERLSLVIPFCEGKRKGLTIWTSPPFAPFCGPLYGMVERTPAKQEKFWRDHLEVAAKATPADVALAEMIAPPGVLDVRGLLWEGWHGRPHYNYVSRWTKPGEWESAIDGSARRQARKAREAGLVTVAHPSGYARNLQQLWRANAAKQKLDEELAENIGRLGAWLEEMKWGFVMEVLDAAGTPHAAALVGHDGQRVYYLAGASDPEHLGSGAPTLLHFAIMEEIDKRGLPGCYDWVGANTESIARFKRNFGPELEMLVAARKESKSTELLRAAKRFLRS